MHPVLFDFALPSGVVVEVSTYRAMYTLAATAAVGLAWALAVRLGMPSKRSFAVIVAAALGLPVGARLWHVATNFPIYAEEPARVWTLAPTGHAMFGGIALASIVGMLASRRAGLDPWRLADVAAPALAVGIAVMRVGCFANGCCFGLPTGGWSGVVFPVASPAHFWQIAHDFVGLMEPPIAAHPTQLYELAGSLVCGVLALVLLRRRVVPGTAFLTFIGAFAAVRWANWQLRVHPDTLTNPAIYGPIYASVIVLAAGLVALRYRSGVRPSAAETSVDTAVGYRGR